MPFLYLDTAVALMARERLRQLRDDLRAKANADPTTPRTLIEQRIEYLADKAYSMMNGHPNPPAEHFPGAVRSRAGEMTSQFYLMGAVGPNITAYSSLFADGQSWLVDMLRKGTPDENRERVVANTAKLPFTFWSLVQFQVNGGSASDDIKKFRLDQMRAFVLGHLCHVAAELVAAPYVDDVTFHKATPTQTTTFTRAEAISKIDEAIRDNVLLPSIPSKDPDISRWWPAASEVPSEFFPAFAGAIAGTYYNDGKRPQGLAEFEERFAKYSALPDVSDDLVKDGYSSFRSILSTGYEWSFWKWFAVLTGVFAPLLFTVPAYALLPEGKKVHVEPAPGEPAPNREKQWYEVIGLQYAGTALVPPIYSLVIGATTGKGFTTETIVGLVLSGVLLIPAVTYFVSLGVEMSTGVRWGVLLATPVVLELAYVVWMLLIRGGSEKYHKLLAWVFLLHVALALVGTGYIAIPPFGKSLAKGPGDGTWWLAMLLLGAIVFGFWCLTSFILTKRFATSTPDGLFPVSQRHFARLFDDASLYGDLGVPDPNLAQLSFPSGSRKLLKLWWTGAGDMWVRSMRDHLEFSTDGTTTPAKVTSVLAPLAPTKLSEFADYLSRAVHEPTPKTGVVMAAPVYDADKDYILAPGEVFIDFADEDRSNESASDRSAAGFRKLGTANDDKAYVLAHAPKPYQAIRYSARGAVPPAETVRVTTALNGPGLIHTTAATPTMILGDAATTFWTFFRVGDYIQLPGVARRVVTGITADNQLTVNLPIVGLVAAPPAGVAYQRVIDDRTQDSAALGKLQVNPLFGPPFFIGVGGHRFVPTTVLTQAGAGPDFAANLVPGDVIRVSPSGGFDPQERTVVSVDSPTQITIDMPFSFNEPTPPAPVGGGAPPAMVTAGPMSYERVGREAVEGYPFVGGPEVDLQGTALMEQAGDLAALLCLGGASQLLDQQQRTPGAPGFPGTGEMTKVVQVFRNWNLDRRRLNEWRMLITGGAVSEKHGDFAADDAAMLTPEVGSNWSPQSTAGEPTALKLGWVPLFRRWTEMATTIGQRTNATRSYRPGDPSNLDLSRAMAFLLDTPEPTP